MRFELLAGAHTDGEVSQGNRVIYRPGDVIETDVDLAKMFGSDKFRKMDESEPNTPKKRPQSQQVVTVPTREELNKMSMADLRALAAEEEIDVSTTSKKEEVVNMIISSLGL